MESIQPESNTQQPHTSQTLNLEEAVLVAKPSIVKKVLVLLVTLFLIGIISVLGYFTYKYFEVLKNIDTNTQTQNSERGTIPNTTENNDQISDLQTYKNDIYNFSLNYPKNYKLISDPSGWPNSIAIISRENVQSYDLIIEVSNSKQEYETTGKLQNNFAVKPYQDKFIILYNPNNSDEVQTIIDSFKFTAGAEVGRSCRNSTLGFELPQSGGWSCTTSEYGQVTEILSNKLEIFISGLGRGPYCTEPDTDPSSPRYEANPDPNACTVTSFLKNDLVDVDLYQSYGKDIEIFGAISGVGGVSVKLSNPDTKSFSQEDLTTIKELLKSIQKI